VGEELVFGILQKEKLYFLIEMKMVKKTRCLVRQNSENPGEKKK